MILPIPLSTAGQAAASLYAAGAGVRRWAYRHALRPQRLRARVISVGNLAWGGTGKTPFTIWLAKRLTGSGLRPSILTRGYRRASDEPLRLLFPGASAEDARRDGDEVQLYLRHRVNVPVAIGASRVAAGRLIEERFRVDAHLLDDGFQHLALARDLDLVLIDACNPWGARWGVGRVLRETPRALRRAHAIIITNCNLLEADNGPALATLSDSLKRIHPGAPLYFAHARITHFMEEKRRRVLSLEEMQNRRAVAFCGIGSPENFSAALRRAGVSCLAQRPFHDHHAYRVEDLKELEVLARQRGADCLLTTEKDLVNLPGNAALEIPLYWAATQFEIAEEAELLRWIGDSLEVSLASAATASPASLLPVPAGEQVRRR
jgi:tetraacyldisaccharide 4'-kinase